MNWLRTKRHLRLHPLSTISLLFVVILLSGEIALESRSFSAAGMPDSKEDVLYVSSQGNDTWSGRLPAPNAAKTDGPLASLARARDAVRSMHVGKALSKPVTVFVRGGTYMLSAPLEFLPEDSGSANCPITYASYRGEKVIVSGGRTITGWRKATSGREGSHQELWTVEVPGVKEGEWYFHQLFVNGQRRQRARSPNTGFYHADGVFEAGNPSRFKFHPGDIHAAWAEQGDVEVVGLEKWAEFRMPIKAVDMVTNTATLSDARQEFGDDKNARYWVENAADALDAPGEWFLDRRSGVLSYLAMPGEEMSGAQVTASNIPQLIRLAGNDATNEPVHDIVFRGLTLAHTDWQLPAKGYADMQAAFDIPAAVELRCARRCRIEQCSFTHLGRYALEIHHGSQNDEVVGNEMTDLGAGGVKIGDPEIPNGPAQTTSGIVVSENYIRNIGIVYPAAVGVWIGQSSGNTIAHNEIADTYYTAISLGWTWGYGPTAAHDNRIEFNSLHDIGRGLLSDMGCIYSLGVQPGTVERDNLCHDVSRYEYGGWGLYTDEGSSHILIENNIVYRTQDGGFHQHYGQENIVRNNIFAFGDEAQLRRTRNEDHLSFTFEHNIVYWKGGKLLDGDWSNGQFRFDYNLYWPGSEQLIQFGKESMADWQKHGRDVNSLVADPRFVDPSRGDFRLEPDSPAAKIGFQLIDISQMGRVDSRFRGNNNSWRNDNDTGSASSLPSGVRFLPGPINGLLVGGKVLIYGDAENRVKAVPFVLFTEARRDVVWAGAPLVARGAAAIVPENERTLFENPGDFWKAYETKRFHDYSQVNTKVLREPLHVSRAVRGGETLDLNGVQVEVIATPGYTPGAVSYLLESGGKRIACTGDLIYGDGQLFDLSSLQDAIPDAKARGYHGYAARAGELINSLRKIEARQPDVLVPARGPLIQNPREAINRLISRLQALLASHFATDALRWYWGDDNLRIRSKAALGGRLVDSMPMAEQRPLPNWALAIGNSRLLFSKTGTGFLIDAGYEGTGPKIQQLFAEHRLKSVEGIWITHYHDDHTDFAQALATRYHCPLYFTPRLTDILEHPSHYRMPCLTAARITSGRPQPDGTHMRWHEFQFTFFDFPGQTLYHDGLLVERNDGSSLFFTGDSFTPSGIDDYCLQNRDFVDDGEGYIYCLNVLERMPSNVWLVNQHVEPTFRFSPDQFERMRTELLKRRNILKQLAPWPDPNYEIDESWAAIAPYGSEVHRGGNVTLYLRILNHSPQRETYDVKWNVPRGWKISMADREVAIPPHQEGTAQAVLTAEGSGLKVVTADVGFNGQQLHEWTEALVQVK